MRIAINECYGGFSLNNECAKLLKEKGVKVTFEGEYYLDGSGPKRNYGGEECHYLDNNAFGIKDNDYNAWRADPRLIETLETLGPENCGGSHAQIVIVDIPDDINWFIDEYDGIETVHEEYRSW